MFELNTLPLAANALLLVVLSFVDLKRTKQPGLLMVLWTVIIVVLEYAILSVNGGSRPLYQLFSLKFPLALTPLLTLGLVLLFKSWRYQKWSILAAFVFLILIAGSRPGLFEFAIASCENTVFERILLQVVLSIAFILCVLVPYVCLSDEVGKPWSYRIHLPWDVLRGYIKPILLGVLCFTCVLVITNIAYKGYTIRILWIEPLSTLTIIGMLNLFYIAVLEQTVCFGLARKVVERLFPNEDSSLWEILVYAGLYASLYYYYHPGAILSQFGYGLALGYIFQKTKSLGYGIALSVIIHTFTM